MAQDGPDGLQPRACAQQVGGKRMPEDVRSGRHALDPAAFTRARKYAGNLGGRTEWPERGLRAYEQVRIGGLGTGRGNVVQDRVANILG